MLKEQTVTECEDSDYSDFSLHLIN